MIMVIALDYEYRVIKSKRKTAAIEIDEDCNLILRLPLRYSQKSVDKLISDHKEWIEKHMIIQREKQKNKIILSDEQIKALRSRAMDIIPERVEYFSNIMGLKPSGVKITSAQKRFGSCSGKNSLCFSYILMQYPMETVDYVVVHELAHIVHKNHSKEFYRLIEKYLPDYKLREKMLKRR
ncbi:MAG: M48 family metallopeptidase [Ruminococcus sp.]|nr:M48 family metallopeptidase [Ruminococcus sp.]